jgi:hypothetical protein
MATLGVLQYLILSRSTFQKLDVLINLFVHLYVPCPPRLHSGGWSVACSCRCAVGARLLIGVLIWWFGASDVHSTLHVKYRVDTRSLSGGEWAPEVLSRRFGWRLEGRSLAARQTLVQRFSFFIVPRSTCHHLIRGIGGMPWVLQYLILSTSLF